MFLRTITFAGGGVSGSGSACPLVSLMWMPLPLAEVILFFWTTMSLLRAPMKIAEAGLRVNGGSSTRAWIQFEVTRTRVLLKMVANDMSSTLVLCSIRMSRCRGWSPSSPRKIAAALWRSNRFEVIRTCLAPSSEKMP